MDTGGAFHTASVNTGSYDAATGNFTVAVTASSATDAGYGTGTYTLNNGAGFTTTASLVDQTVAGSIDTLTYHLATTPTTAGTYHLYATGYDVGTYGVASTPSLTVAPLELSIGDVTLNEGNAGTTSYTFTVSLSQASGQTVTVNYATANGTATTAGGDYVATIGTLTFAPGQLSKQINVTANGDTTFEADETFSVNLSGSTNAAIADGQGIGTISNDDVPPTITLSGGTTIAEGNAGTTLVPITATLSQASGLPTTVALALGGTATQGAGADYTVSGTTITIPAGSLSGFVNVIVNGDTAVEPNETVTLSISSTTNATPVGFTQIVAIQNDDVGYAITASNPTVAEGNPGPGNSVIYTVVRAGDTSGAATAAVALSGTATRGTDYTTSLPANGEVSFAPGVATATFTVTTVPDTVVEPNESVIATITSVTGGAGSTIISGTATTTITNDDQYGVSITAADAVKAEGSSGSTPFTFTVARTGGTADAVTLDYAVTGLGASPASGSDFTGGAFPTGQVTLAAGQASTTLTVNVAGDGAVEANEDFTVTLSNAPVGTAIAQATAEGTIQNDDVTPSTTTVTTNGTGGHNVTTNDPGTLQGQATPAIDTVFYAGTQALTLPDGFENAFLSGQSSNTVAVNGNAGNNAFVIASGSWTIDGRGGSDVAVYATELSGHTIQLVDANNVVVTGSEGTQRLANISGLGFAHDQITFDFSNTAAQVVRLYDATLHRAPDIGGGTNALAQLQGGVSLAQLSQAFLNSAEGQLQYAPTQTNKQFVDALYTNVLHRAPDAGGEANWVAALDAGKLTRGAELAAFSESPEHTAFVGFNYVVGLVVDHPLA